MNVIGGPNMRTGFETFLIGRGYKIETPAGHPSTIYDYIKRIDCVCKWENLSWESLATKIAVTLPEYDVGGPKQHLGERSHRAVINALKKFAEFVENR